MLVFDTKKLIILGIILFFVIVSIFSFINSGFRFGSDSNIINTNIENSVTQGKEKENTENVVEKGEPTSENSATNPNKEKGIPDGLDFVVYLVGKNTRVKVEDKNLNKKLTDILLENNISINRVKKVTINGKEGTIEYKTKSGDLVLVFIE